MIYFSADLHLWHRNILRLCDRPFPTIEDHNIAMIRNHNSVIGENDTSYLLGDIAFRCTAEQCADCLYQMNGKKHILLGNHDKPLRQAYKKGLLDKSIKNKRLTIIGGEDAIYDSSLAIAQMITVNNQKIFISHYALRTWPSAFRKSWHLFGHSHSNLAPLYKSFDVGVDGESKTHKRFHPWSWDEVKLRMDMVDVSFTEATSDI